MRFNSLVHLIAAAILAGTVAAADRWFERSVSVAFLYAVPMVLVAARFYYPGVAIGGVVALGLEGPLLALRPDSLYFEAIMLGLGFSIAVGLLAARMGRDGAITESGSGVDEATGLPSRRAILGALSLELTRCVRYDRPMSVLLVGLYPSGRPSVRGPSPWLTEVGEQIERNLRDVDVVGHYSALEFLAVLPETSKQDAREVAARLRSVLHGLQLSAGDLRSLPEFIVGVGVAGCPEDSGSVQGLLDAAEGSLSTARTRRANKAG